MTTRNPTNPNDVIFSMNTINPKKAASKSRLSCILILTLILTSTWLLSFRPVRLKIGDYYFKQGKFDQAIHWYGKRLRKARLRNLYGQTPQILSDTAKEGEILTKLVNACLNSGSFHLEEGRKYSSTNPDRAESEFTKVLRVYEFSSRNVHDGSIRRKSNSESPKHEVELSSLVKRACVNLAEIYKIQKPKKILELCGRILDLENIFGGISFTEERTNLLSLMTGINLLSNPYLSDSNNAGIPDDYIFGRFGPKATYPNKEIIKTGEFNTYHVWQKEGNGWFATSFQIGRVPPNTFFTYSIEIKRIDTKGEARPMLFTTRSSNPEWGSGSDYSETGLVKDMGDGWKREFHTIKTNHFYDIMLSGWLVAWHYGQAEGQIYVRKPKIEIGDRATSYDN